MPPTVHSRQPRGYGGRTVTLHLVLPLSGGSMTTTDSKYSAQSPESTEAADLDVKFEKVLREAQTRVAVAPLATEESIRAGNAALTLAEEAAARTVLERVARHELITEDEFAKRLSVSGKWIADAIADHRLFIMSGPAEVKYFPAFYGDPTLERHLLERVCEEMGTFPGRRSTISSRASRRFCGPRRRSRLSGTGC